MAASIRLDQAGIAASSGPGARTDGILTGALVTIENDSGQPCVVKLFWVPPDDTTAVSTLAQTSPTTFTFSPDTGIAGTYTVDMIEGEGTAGETRDTKVFGIRTASKALLIPGLNEKGDPTITLASTAAQKAAAAAVSYNDEPNPEGLEYTAWWQAWRELYDAVEAGGGGSDLLPPVVQVGAAYTLLLADSATQIRRDNAGANTTTIPANATTAFPVGTIIYVVMAGLGQSSLVAAGGVTINFKLGKGLDLDGQFAGCYVHKIATDEWDAVGELVP